MSITVTSQISSEMKRYKKILETDQLFQYAYRHKDTEFYYIVYKRFGNATGSLILSDNPNSSRKELLQAGRAFFQFNRVILEAADQLVKDIQRPTELLEKLKILLRKAEWNEVFSLQPFQQDIQSLYETIDFYFQTQEELHNILLEMQEIERHARERGFIQDEDVHQMINLNVKHYLSTYEQGRKMIHVIPIEKKVKAHFINLKGQINNEDEELRKSLFICLEALTRKQNVDELMKSNATFEKDEYKNPISISEGPEGLIQKEKLLRREIDYIFETNIVKDFRNLV